MQALAGRRVLVTRAAGQASALADALRARGAEVLHIPTIEIASPESYCGLDAALTTVRAYDWIVFTSANAVEAFAARGRRLGIPAEARRVAVIGPATGRAVIAQGVAREIALQPVRAVAESLLEALCPEVPGASVLLVRAAEGRDVLVQGLQEAGAELTIAVAYRNVIPEASIALLKDAFRPGRPTPEIATFSSGSSATNLEALMSAAGVSMPTGIVTASIGPVTSAVMKALGWQVTLEAQEASIDSLVQAVVTYCDAQSD